MSSVVSMSRAVAHLRKLLQPLKHPLEQSCPSNSCPTVRRAQYFGRASFSTTPRVREPEEAVEKNPYPYNFRDLYSVNHLNLPRSFPPSDDALAVVTDVVYYTPRLPIPNLDETLDRYLESLRLCPPSRRCCRHCSKRRCVPQAAC
eukprot:2109877-Rhodomonas_salina.2